MVAKHGNPAVGNFARGGLPPFVFPVAALLYAHIAEMCMAAKHRMNNYANAALRMFDAPADYGTNPLLIHSNVRPVSMGKTFCYKEMKNER